MTLHRTRVLVTATMAATGLLLASCSGSPTTAGAPATVAVGTLTSSSPGAPTGEPPAVTPAAGSSSPSACTLVTEQELTTLLGADPGPGTDSSVDTTSSCAYTQGAAAVTIVVDSSGGRSQFDMMCSTDQPQPDIQKVEGVRDGACLTIVGGGPIAAMYILAGSDLVSINIQGGLNTKITPDALTALGKAAGSRI